MKNFYSRLKWLVIILISILLFMVAKPANASFDEIAFQQEVSGVVTDQAGIPLPGVTVSILGESRGVVTDMDGRYLITVNPQDQLVFSFIGFKTIQESVSGRGEINIELEEDVSQLAEVQINAGYYNTTRRESTGNISRVTAEEIERQPVTNPLAAMQGRMPGVNITQTTGVPGGGFEVQVRGRNSISAGNDPLYIVNGIPFSGSSLSNPSLGIGILPGRGLSPLNGIDPSDIESIEVLKDADATAIYGSRGANGVVLITTKKGKFGESKINVNVSRGFGEVSNQLDLLSTEDYLEMRREAFENDGLDIPFNAYDVNGTWPEEKYTDWQEVLRGGKASYLDTQISFSGGKANTRYFIGGGYQEETSVFLGNFKYSRTSATTSVNHIAEDGKFQIDFSGSYAADKNFQPATDISLNAPIIPPNAPDLFDEEGNLNWENSTWRNPAAQLESIYETKSNTLLAGANLSYKLFKNFELKTNLGFNSLFLKELRTFPSTTIDPAFGLGSAFSNVNIANSSRYSWIVEPQVEYSLATNAGTIEVLAGGTLQQENQEGLRIYGSGFTSNQFIRNLAAANNIFVLGNDDFAYKYAALFARINYSLLDRYYLNLTGRRDGSSRFGPDKRYANFGAVGMAWIFTEESFFKNNAGFLSFGKLRGSYGLTGSDNIGNYQYLDSYYTTGVNYNGRTGLKPSRLFNPDFAWETNRKFEAAIELSFFENGLYTSLSYYNNRSSNQLVGIPLPGTTGFSSLNSNLDATVQNTGWELELNASIFKKENFYWNTSFNLTIPKNELISFPELEGSTYANQYVIGESLLIRKVYESTGIDPQTGLYTFTDFNNDGKISAPDDQKILKNLNPNFYGGFSSSIGLKDLSLDFLFQFVKQEGRTLNYFLTLPGVMVNQPVEVMDRWEQVGDTNTYQKFSAGADPAASAAHNRFTSSDAAIGDASFIRLKNLSLSYDLSGLVNFDSSIFILGQNLFTLTSYKGPDPEVQSKNNIPPLRLLSVGAKINF